MFQPLPASKWDYKLAAHLLNRAGFGGSPAEIDRLVSLGLDKAVAHFVDFDKIPDATAAPTWAKPESDEERAVFDAARRNAATPKEKNKLNNERRNTHRKQLLDLLGWWLGRMEKGPRPLQEKLTLFWHDHFATSFDKVQNAYLMWLQNDTFRRNATGNWTKMLEELTVDPAMLVWLDLYTSNKKHPNENFAREVMELFSLGEGNYTEKDVLETARALTGLTLDKTRQKHVYKDDLHDEGEKTVLGKTGNFGWQDVLNLIQMQPQSQRFIAGKLWQWFSGVTASKELGDALAEELRRGANNFQPLLRTIFRSQEFYAAEVVSTQVKNPTQWLVGTCRLLERELPSPEMADSILTSLGQRLFWPPDVNGWDDGPGWITTNNLLERYNLVEKLIFGDKARNLAPAPLEKVFTPAERSNPAALVAAIQKRFFLAPLEDRQRAALQSYLTQRRQLDQRSLQQTVRLAMATPEYQLI